MATLSETQQQAQRAAQTARLRRIVRQAVTYSLMTFLAFFFLFPIVFMLVASLKPDRLVISELDSIRAFIPDPAVLTLENFQGVFERVPFEQYMFNSIFITASIVIGGLVVNSMAAFALARMQWPGRKTLLAIIISLIIIPFEAIAVPLLYQVNRMPWLTDGGWLDSYHVQIIPFLADAFSIYLFYQFFISLPKDFDEAARVDGAGFLRIYSTIILPLSRPVFATVAILQFLQYWSFFMWPLMVTRGEEHRPLMVGMQQFFGEAPLVWGQIMAYAAMVTLPVLIIFLMFQSWFVRGVTSSGVKG